jgi:hypothetical protein
MLLDEKLKEKGKFLQKNHQFCNDFFDNLFQMFLV